MPVVTYETLFLLDSTKVTADADAVKNQVHHILERHGGQIIISRPWDYNHKLAYPIKKQKKGAFHIVYYTMDSLKQAELEKDFRLSAEGVILRLITSRLDPKWQEAVLQVAREDTGNGFALRGMHEETTAATDPAALGGEPGMVPHGEGEMAGAGGGHRGGFRGPRRGDHAEKPE
jgi:small subunit ribosomal protein S6